MAMGDVPNVARATGASRRSTCARVRAAGRVAAHDSAGLPRRTRYGWARTKVLP